MDKQTYIVFHLPTAQTTTTRGGPRVKAAGGRPRGPAKRVQLRPEQLERQKLDPAQAAQARRLQASGVRPKDVFARPMAMKLVEPVKRGKNAASAASGEIAWGIQAVRADTSPFSGKKVKVAILDTGIDKTHPAFKSVKITTKDFTGSGSAADTDGHGTHCAGTIAGQDINGYRFGIARDAELLIAKVLGGPDGGSTEGLFKAMLWALDEGAQIISMSLGWDFPGHVEQAAQAGMPLYPATSQALEAYRDNLLLFGTIVDLMRSKNYKRPALVVAATGNESDRKGAKPYTVGIAPPAATAGFVGVAALGQKGVAFTVADFSNTGGLVAAPGVEVTSAKLGGGLVSYSGTSMATPHVAGVAALWAEKLMNNGEVDMQILQAKLLGQAMALPTLASADIGSGLVQAPQS